MNLVFMITGYFAPLSMTRSIKMAVKKETWREKLVSTTQRQQLPRVVEVNEKMSKKWGEGTCVIPSPVEVDALMKSVPKGKLITMNQIRAVLAAKYQATFG